MSERDRAVLEALGTVRVLSGAQIERLRFAEIAASARGRIRRRVMGRLVDIGLVQTLDRRVGGVRAGSAGLVYALSAAGQRLRDLDEAEPVRRRPAYTPGALFLAHSLAVSEIFVGLHEELREWPGERLATFAVETAARFPVTSDLVLRPDALVVLSAGDVEDVWWLEVDRGTESLPRVGAMLRRYLDFAGSGQAGPRGVVPRVLIAVESEARERAVRGLIRRLPEPASVLFVVTPVEEAPRRLVAELSVEKPP